MKGDLLIKAEAAFNVEGGKWTRADEEAFARGFEQYLKEGTAPTEELKTVFQKAAEFLARIYKSLQELLHINDDIRKVYDELLGGEKSVLREAENNIGKTRTKEDRVFIKTVLNTVAEVKQSLERIKNTDIVNKETGITARISSTGINKMTSNKAVEKSEANGFTRSEHYGAAAEIKTLYEKARLIEEHKDRNSDPNIKSIKRFLSSVELNDKKQGEALITVKETEEHGNRIYSLELEEIKPVDRHNAVAQNAQPAYSNSASKRWETTDTHARKITEPNAPSNTNISENAETVNSRKQQKSKIDEAYDKAAEAARLANEESIKQTEADKKDSGDILFQAEAAKEELNEIEDVRKKYEGTEQWLKAPDGSDSNLNEKQWLQVRTDSFKKWFGDWESDSENKVLDDNGEPLVVYHGSPEILGDVFEQGHSFYGGNLGHWFTTVETAARDYAFNRETGNYGDVKAVFLKTNKIIDLLPLGARCTSKEFCELMNDYGFDFGRGSNKTYRTNELYQKYQNDILPNISYGCIRMIDVGHTYVVKGGNQIKSATDNTGSFDPDNYSILFQTAPLTEEEKAFKETAAQYRKDINRYFAGEMKSNETVTVCKTTPTILRAAGFEDKPITVSGATLKHITDKHKDITQDILSSLPEQLLNPVAVFKSQNKEQSNSRLIFTEHFVNGKPVLAALEMNYTTDHTVVNSIRSVYEKDSIQTIQNWINDGNLLYVDDKRVDEWSATTGLQLPLRAFSKLNPSSNIIGENAGNVNTVLTKSSIIGDNADTIYLKAEKEFYDEVTVAETKQEVKENLEKIIVGKDITEAENLFYLFVHL